MKEPPSESKWSPHPDCLLGTPFPWGGGGREMPFQLLYLLRLPGLVKLQGQEVLAEMSSICLHWWAHLPFRPTLCCCCCFSRERRVAASGSLHGCLSWGLGSSCYLGWSVQESFFFAHVDAAHMQEAEEANADFFSYFAFPPASPPPRHEVWKLWKLICPQSQ